MPAVGRVGRAKQHIHYRWSQCAQSLRSRGVRASGASLSAPVCEESAGNTGLNIATSVSSGN